MKCPKCGYLGFEDVERCRHCGYEFSLISTGGLLDLPLRARDEPPGAVDDVGLFDETTSPGRRSADSAVGHTAGLGRTSPRDGDLLLFGADEDRGTESADDPPLVLKSSPRPPLAVRRATPDVSRLTASVRQRSPMLDLSAAERESGSDAPALRSNLDPLGRSAAALPADLGARVAAAAVDVAILLAIDAVVVYLTLQVCGLTIAELGIIPKAPLLVFLAAQNVGYLVGFTMSGQTLGKMAAGIRVVSAQGDAPLDVGRSVVRTLVWVGLAMPAGLGFATALVGREHRGLHDRCAGSKVVRAPA